MIKGVDWGFTYEKFKFPCGELQVKISSTMMKGTIDLLWEYENNDEIFEFLLVCDALRRCGVAPNILYLPYVPYARQDRIQLGESLSIKVFCDLINQQNFSLVQVMDPHSDVTSVLIDRCEVFEQYMIFSKWFDKENNFFLISPDGGALKKIWKLAERVDCEQVIQFSKHRDAKTGEITGTTMPYGNLWGRDCYIVDDICDGGRTFIEIAKVLKENHPGKIVLMVTHGFFTKGLEVFDGLIDEIYTRKGRVK